MRTPTEIPQEIKHRFVLKNVKTGFGHDLMGMYCDLFLDKKKIGYFNDDGWGGETEINISKESEAALVELLEFHNWRDRMFNELGWDFYDSVSEISNHSLIECMIEYLTDEKQKEKELKKIAKKAETKIIWGKWNHYSSMGFMSGMPLRDMIRVYGVQKIQQIVDKDIKPHLKEGDQILNPNFEELGLIR